MYRHGHFQVKMHACSTCAYGDGWTLCDSKRGCAFFGGAASLRHFFIWEVDEMDIYKELYYKLFAAVTDAVESLEQNEPQAAKKELIAAMRAAEETFLSENNRE